MINDIKKASEDFKVIRSNTFKALKDEKRSYDNIIISMDEFSRFQHINDSCADSMKTIPEICSLIEKIPESIYATSLNDAFDKQDAKNKLCKVVINELDMYLKTISSDQMLLNKIAAQFTTDEMQLPDPEFFGTINTFEAFDNLIASLIESHIPQKFVMYSSWLLTSDNIKGQSEEYKPIWGQFRGCFFPPQENFIYKFALSKSAVIDNKNEVKINEYLKGKNKNDMIAQILDHGPTYSVIKMEKLYGIGEIPQNTEEYIDYFDSKLGYEKFVFKDLHSNNIGFRTKKPNNDYTINDNPVIVDYGMLNLRENH